MFAHRKKTLKADEIVHKKYIFATNVFEFGPLLAGKSRDKYLLFIRCIVDCIALFMHCFSRRISRLAVLPENLRV